MFAAPLADEYTVITPDLRGRGRSVCYHSEHHSWPQLADDVVVLLDHLGLDRAAVGGSSVGSGVALLTALRHPQRVAALVLANACWLGSERGWYGQQEVAATPIFAMADLVREQGLDGAIETLASRFPPQMAEMVRERWGVHDARSVGIAIDGLRSHPQPFERLEELEGVDAPTLIVVVGSDPLHPREISEIYLSTLPRATLADVSEKIDLTNIANLDSRELMTQIADAVEAPVRAFLSEHLDIPRP